MSDVTSQHNMRKCGVPSAHVHNVHYVHFGALAARAGNLSVYMVFFMYTVCAANVAGKNARHMRIGLG